MLKKINFKTVKKRYKDFLIFTSFLKPYWKTKVFVIIISSVGIPLSLVLPYMTKLLIDEAFINKDLLLFIRLAIIGAVIFIITSIIDGIVGYLNEKLLLKINFDINRKVFEHIQNLSLRFFQDKSTGEHIYKLNFDTESVARMVSETVPQFPPLILRFLFTLVIIFYINWKMALLCLVISPILYLETYYYFPKRHSILQKQIGFSESIFVRLEEVFKNIHLVKAFGKESFEIKVFLDRQLQRLKLLMKSTRLRLYSTFLGTGLVKIILGIVSLYGGYLIIKRQMSLGSLTAVMIYLSQLVELQNSVNGFFEQIAFDFISCDRLNEILDAKPEIIDKPNAKTISLSEADIEFDRVRFGYNVGMPVLENLSFYIKGGSFIALVGHSGCGKTTLLNLILRLYEPQSGKLLISGYDIQDLKMDCLRDQIGVALQEPFLWNDTIENNMRYGNPNASFSQIIEVAKLVGMDSFIKILPNGYRTILGENAALISQGQKQRIAIARAIIKNPAIIILDEAMSSLDSESEDMIIDNLKEKFKSSTIIIVSHRLSTAKRMDLLYFLEAPEKIDIGSHEELLIRNPKYRELFASQIETERNPIYPTLLPRLRSG